MKKKTEWQAEVRQRYPEVVDITTEAKAAIHYTKIQMKEYQAEILYALASRFNGSRVLEIGTAHGYSTYYLACACPFSKIVTLNPNRDQLRLARKGLREFRNVLLLAIPSQQYLHAYNGDDFGFIFVDGDHNNVERDFPWFNHLMFNGMILFHDYTPWVKGMIQKVSRFERRLGRPPDISIIDEEQRGMVGWYRQKHETY